MGIHNKLEVKEGEHLCTKDGNKTRWIATSDSHSSRGKTYVAVVCECGNPPTHASGVVRVAAVWNGKSNGCNHCAGLDRREIPVIGEVIGDWVILRFCYGRKKLLQVKVECKCGFKAWRYYACLKSEQKRYLEGRKEDPVGCINCRPIKQEKPDIIGRVLARQWKKYDWVTVSRVKFLATQPCFYCGIGPSNTSTTRRKSLGDKKIAYQGMDEVVYGKGHTLGNVLPCCIDCNKLKNNHSLEEFCNWWNRKRSVEFCFTPQALIQAAEEFGIQLEFI